MEINSERVLLSFLGEGPHLPAWMRVQENDKVLIQVLKERAKYGRGGLSWAHRWQQGSWVAGVDPKHSVWPLRFPLPFEEFSGCQKSRGAHRRNKRKELRFRNRRKTFKRISWNALRTCSPKQLQLLNGRVLSRMIGRYQLTISRATRWPEEYKSG